MDATDKEQLHNCKAWLVIAYPGGTQADLDTISRILKTVRKRDYSGVLDLVHATISSPSVLARYECDWSRDSGEEGKAV